MNYIVNTLGQRTKRTTSDAATSVVTDWSYDALGQVTSEDQPGTTTDRAFQYDHIGNRKKSANSLSLPEDDNYTSNALNQYTSISSGQLTSEPQYDFDGNMTHGPHPADPSIPALFFYDAENRLLEIRNATTGVTLLRNHYDAFHRLIRVTALHNGQSTTEYILWKGWTLVSRFVSIGGSVSETFHYTWGKDLSGSEQGAGGVGGLLAITRVPATGDASTRYPLYDGTGNITALVTTNGSLSATYQYDAFGNTLSPTDHDGSGWVNHNIHGFSTKPTFGHQGLHYYGYRWYTSPQGRWINRDPIAERGGVNLYGFVGNNVVSEIDILGLAKPKKVKSVNADRKGHKKCSTKGAEKHSKAQSHSGRRPPGWIERTPNGKIAYKVGSRGRVIGAVGGGVIWAVFLELLLSDPAEAATDDNVVIEITEEFWTGYSFLFRGDLVDEGNESCCTNECLCVYHSEKYKYTLSKTKGGASFETVELVEFGAVFGIVIACEDDCPSDDEAGEILGDSNIFQMHNSVESGFGYPIFY